MEKTLPASDVLAKKATVALEAVVVASPDKRLIGRAIRLGDGTRTLGRSDDNDLTVDDNRMSREHVRLEWDAASQQPVAADLGSSNGTQVNGSTQFRAALTDGSVVRVGDTLLVVQPRAKKDESDHPLGALLGTSTAMKKVRQEIRTVAPTNLCVLILGETGTGKELVSAEIHRLSQRPGEFVPVNCAAIPDSLAESTLFGHVRGAFTGATGDRPGLFLQAHGGTLLLDELGELPLTLQAKLLRVLEDSVVTAVGGHKSRRVDVRVVAATNVQLIDAADEGRFRADLLGRLEDWVIRLPSLKQRRVDILSILQVFLSGRTLAPDAAEAALVYDWPRNVRELRKVANRLSVQVPEGQTVTLELLPEEISSALRMLRQATPEDVPAATTIDTDAIVEALTAAKGNVTQAAKRLGCGRKTLYRRLTDYEIDPEKYRAD